jgi:signal transduction histidine kinase/CheY-like chemotaxis protein/HPt (histidine-containing phosphotransfer) domain-containing protein
LIPVKTNKIFDVSDSSLSQDRVRNIIRLGFASVLGLTFLLGIVGLYQLNEIKTNMTTIVEVGNEKTALAIKMRDAILSRALSLQRMLITNDYFKRDMELQRYYTYSGDYRQAREKLFSMQTTEKERELHEALQLLTRVAQPINREAAEMLMNEELPRNYENVLEQAIIAQQQLINLLDKFVDMQKVYAKELVKVAEENFQSTIFMMSVVVSLLLIVGSFIAKRVTHLVTIKNKELASKNNELEAAWFEAANATHAKSKFLASMSHEIRTPLTSIIGFAETLGDSSNDPEEFLYAAESIKRSGNHLHQIINDVLDISKIEAGQIELEMMEASPAAILAEVTTMMEEKVKKKGLKLRANYYFPLPRLVFTDPTRLRQILLNLLGNAIKFTSQGIVCINAYYSQNDRMMKFEVSDTGIGMTEEGLAHVFEPFSQADKSTTRKYGGTGLGLSISKQLAEKMGGSIICESKLGVGSTFTATISIGDIAGPELIYESKEIAELTANEQIIHQRNNKYSGKVLLAEDTEENQQLISLHLRKSGVDVKVVGNGEEAVNAALQWDYDLVLMDLQMPVLNGLDAMKILRNANYKNPIVALTAATSVSDRETCKEAGADDFISKPINFENFYEVLDTYLARKNAPKNVFLNQEGNDSVQHDINDDEFREILLRFLERLPQMVETINESCGKKDWETVQSISHQLKGLGGSFGYSQITKIAKNIHESSRLHPEDGMDSLLHELNQELQRIMNQNQNNRKAI